MYFAIALSLHYHPKLASRVKKLNLMVVEQDGDFSEPSFKLRELGQAPALHKLFDIASMKKIAAFSVQPLKLMLGQVGFLYCNDFNYLADFISDLSPRLGIKPGMQPFQRFHDLIGVIRLR